ncbi:MAG: S-layer homology domain-containing protein, partial [candidate division KSB1 bacterium]|nr:S-layer homology domain-containing protein [candidate division KSB1 bacterium]
ENPMLVKRLQYHLVQSGVPLYWFVDVPIDHEAFKAVQWLAAMGIIEPDPKSLRFRPNAFLSKKDVRTWLENTIAKLQIKSEAEEQLINRFAEKVVGDDALKFTRAQFAQLLANTIEASFIQRRSRNI